MSRQTFVGGPYDGYPVSESDRDYLVHTFDFVQGKMAVYELNEAGRFAFIGIADNDYGNGCNCVDERATR